MRETVIVAPGRRLPGVAMPSALLYKKTISRDELVQKYGESTVLRAELTTVMNIMIAVGICSSSEFVDIMLQQCDRIEQQRRADANLDADHGRGISG